MKNNMLFIEFVRELKKSRNRFLSLLLLSFLGVAFFTGIRASGPDMRISADRFYDRTSFFDIRLVSTLGFTDQEMEALMEIEGVEQAVPGYSADVYCKERNDQWSLHLMSLSDSMNQVTLKDGRLPKEKDECVVDEKMLDDGVFHIGDTITIVSKEGEITDTLASETFTIVGSGVSPCYLSSDRGISSSDFSDIDYFVILPEESFILEAYTDFYISVTGADELLCYSEEYKNCVETVAERIEEQKDTFCKMRLESFINQCEQKISDMEQNIADVREDLDSRRTELEEAEQQITNDWTEFNQKEEEFKKAEAALTQKEQTISAGWEKYYSGISSYQSGLKEIEEAEKNLPTQESQLKEAQKQLAEDQKKWNEDSDKKLKEQKLKLAQIELQLLNSQLSAIERATYEKTKLTLKKSIESLEKQKTELQERAAELYNTENELKNTSAQLKQKEEQLEKSYSSLMSSFTELEKSESELHTAQSELETDRNELNDARLELTEKEEALEKDKAEFAEEESNAEAEILKSQTRIEDTKKELEEVTMPSLSVLDRNSVETYVSYEQDAEQIDAIGNTFPIFFLLIAVLICMMTMNRMVEENRTQIGTWKALGYKNTVIAFQYLIYAFLATFIGSMLGMLLGQLLLPRAVIHAYGTVYSYLPSVATPIHLTYSVISVLAAVGCTLAVTAAACGRTAFSAPAVLMRPKTPKEGKRIFLEHINFIWKHLSFLHKSTFRNLFRYKKRLVMTVLGIGVCTGLLIAGFGLEDSIHSIGNLQYGEIYTYDGTLTLDGACSEEAEEQLRKKLDVSEQIENYLFQYSGSIEIISNGRKRTTDLLVPEIPGNMTDFIRLRNRVTGEKYELDADGIIISEKLANILGVQAGDPVQVKTDDKKSADLKVIAVTENYFGHYVYMSPELYEKVYGEKPFYDHVFMDTKDTSDEAEAAIREAWMNLDAVTEISFLTEESEQAQNKLESMEMITYILVLAAAVLAGVGLYDLNYVNICERSRELAVLKALGFHDIEVSMYVFRENIWLTLFGLVFGSGVGMVLHPLAAATTEVDRIMFGRNMDLSGFGWSISLIVLISALVNYATHYKLTKIDIAESAKSTE